MHDHDLRRALDREPLDRAADDRVESASLERRLRQEFSTLRARERLRLGIARYDEDSLEIRALPKDRKHVFGHCARERSALDGRKRTGEALLCLGKRFQWK